MYVACPSCKAVYQIQAEHLHAARGQVRCSACRNTFSAFEAVFDDPAQALAHAEKQHAERDIEALVSKALEQVPGGEAAPEQRQAEVIPAVDEQPAGEAGAESLRPEADYVPKGTQDHEAQLPEQQRAEATPADEEQPVAEAWAESRQPEAAYVPKGTQGDRVKPPLAEAVSGGAEGAD